MSKTTKSFRIIDIQDEEDSFTKETLDEVADFVSELWWYGDAPKSVIKALNGPTFDNMKSVLEGSGYSLEAIGI